MSAVAGAGPAPSGSSAPHCDEAVLAYVQDQGITEVLHFTTDSGLLGIAATGALLSRDGLCKERYLEYISIVNCPDRSRDARWTGHVSMSITKINHHMLRSSKRWHPGEEVWWSVLAFDVNLLGHPGVWFADSNNAYPITKRGTGVDGLAMLFADTVIWGYHNTPTPRASTPRNMPTHEQAEVLYPDRVPLQWLRRIYLPNEDNIDYVNGLPGSFMGLPRVPVECKPEVFG
jgi:hypothetical protein